MLTKVLVYAYCVGVFSSRKIQRRLVEDVAFRVLAAGNEPDFRTIADFRKRHLAALEGFFEQVLRLARELGAPRVGRVAVDGSKVKANASKHKAMSYGRMREKERQLREEVTAPADAGGGDGRRRGRGVRRRSARRRIAGGTATARDSAGAHSRGQAGAGGAREGGGRGRGRARRRGEAGPKAQYNFTDPESRIMKGPDGFVQAYNAQVAVDELQLIVGQAVTQEANDKQQLVPMITTVAQQAGETPTQVLADAGYCSDENLTAISATHASTPTSRRASRNMASDRARVRAGRCRRRDAHRPDAAQAATKAGAAVYPRRKAIVEPVFGQIKQARGFRQFLLRGLTKVRGGMVVGVHDAQHSQAVSPVQLRPRQQRASRSGTSPTPTPPSPRVATTWGARSTRSCDYHGDYSDGLLGMETNGRLQSRPFLRSVKPSRARTGMRNRSGFSQLSRTIYLAGVSTILSFTHPVAHAMRDTNDRGPSRLAAVSVLAPAEILVRDLREPVAAAIAADGRTFIADERMGTIFELSKVRAAPNVSLTTLVRPRGLFARGSWASQAARRAPAALQLPARPGSRPLLL